MIIKSYLQTSKCRFVDNLLSAFIDFSHGGIQKTQMHEIYLKGSHAMKLDVLVLEYKLSDLPFLGKGKIDKYL